MQNLYLVCLASLAVLCAAPLVASRLVRSAKFPSIIYFCFFLVLQQLFFALWARALDSYSAAFPLAAGMVVMVALLLRQRIPAAIAVGESRSDQRIWLKDLSSIIFLALFLMYCFVRAHYPFIAFNNNGDEAGVEKLFNLSLQQSFLFGKHYPPEWVWLAGEDIHYYVFTKSIPGLASWIARVLFGNAETGGVFFILSEAFFGALPPALACAWVQRLAGFIPLKKGDARRVSAFYGLCLALFCMFATHYQAFSLGLKGLYSGLPVDWWSLSREVIPFTDNQYPIWLMILGDSHAYMHAYFLQIMIWGGFLEIAISRQFSILKATGLGLLVAAILLTHPASILVDLTVIGVFSVLYFGYFLKKREWQLLRTYALHGLSAALVALACAASLYKFGGQVRFLMPPKDLASSLTAFINLNFSSLVWLGLLLFHPSILRQAMLGGRFSRFFDEWMPVLYLILGISFVLAGYPACAFALALSCLLYLLLFKEQASIELKIFCFFAMAAFAIWLPPELIAFDHVMDSRVEWIRFQMSLRFWPEGYFLIPFSCALAVLASAEYLRRGYMWCCGVCVVIGLLILSHVPGIANRFSRSGQGESIDGFSELARQYPGDNGVVGYLRNLPTEPRVVIAESCGVGNPQVPHHFGWAGRISAFSGRLGVCGWVRHSMLYNNPLQQRGFQGVPIEDYTNTFLSAYGNFFTHVAEGSNAQARLDLTTLRALGVTHLTFGQFEKQLFPNFSLEKLDKELASMVVYKGINGVGVLKIV